MRRCKNRGRARGRFKTVERSFDPRTLLTWRNGVAFGLLGLAVVVAATGPGFLGRDVDRALAGFGRANPLWLWTAAFCFVGSLVSTALAWRNALRLAGGRLAPADAAARYGIGSLVNGFSPVRIGEAVRLALFARALGGRDRAWRMGSVFGVLTAIRALVFAVVVVIGVSVGALPLWPVLVLVAIACGAALVAVFARRHVARRWHIAHLLDAFREIGRDPWQGARVAAWIVAATAIRLGAAASIAASIGITSPIAAAVIIVATLDLAGLIPLSGNVGITSGAVVVALAAHDVGWAMGVSTGLAFHAIETLAGISFGSASALMLAPISAPRIRQRILRYAGAAATVCIAGGFCTTLVLQLA
jgi:uncharacterized membrane protein YbhN (UPF0104 family)